MPKFNSDTASVGSESSNGKKRFEGVREVVIVNAGYYRKGDTWKAKEHLDDMLADESNPEHVQVWQFKLANGTTEVINTIFKYGREKAKFSDWAKGYKLFGIKANEQLQSAVGHKCKVLFYASSNGYTEAWDRMYAVNVPDSQIEDEFTASLERSDWLRKKVDTVSRYALEKVTVTAGPDVGGDMPF